MQARLSEIRERVNKAINVMPSMLENIDKIELESVKIATEYIEIMSPQTANYLLDALEEQQKSALRPASKFLNNCVITQLKHVKSEIWEIEQEVDYVDDIDKEKALDEINDAQISLETLKAIIEPDEQKRRESMIKTIKKNDDRNYYEVEND